MPPPPSPYLVLSGVALGTIAIASGISAALFADHLNRFGQSAIWLLLAFGVAGASHVFSGMLQIQISRYLRSGGSFALFVFIIYTSPLREPIEDLVFPATDPTPVAENYLNIVDNLDPNISYQETSEWFKNAYPQSQYTRLFEEQRLPLGRSTSRRLHATSLVQNPSGFPRGTYRYFSYVTRFSNRPNETWGEFLAVGFQRGAWAVYGYSIMQLPDTFSTPNMNSSSPYSGTTPPNQR